VIVGIEETTDVRHPETAISKFTSVRAAVAWCKAGGGLPTKDVVMVARGSRPWEDKRSDVTVRASLVRRAGKRVAL